MDLPRLPVDRWLEEAGRETESPTLVLTATGRLQRYLGDMFAAHQARKGVPAWNTPPIFTWHAWLERVWQEHLLTDTRETAAASGPTILLRPAQASVLWQKVINSDPGSRELLTPAGLAALAEQAWSLVHAWEVSLAPADAVSIEEAHFALWASSYADETRTHGWTDVARLPRLISEWIAAGRFAVPERVVLAGFDALDPSQQRLISALIRSGSACLELESATREAVARRLACPDSGAEAEAAARWASARLGEGATSVGIVVQGLSRRVQEVTLALREFLAPEAAILQRHPSLLGGHVGAPFHISAVPCLAEWPLVRAALRLARLRAHAIPLEELEPILLCPYLGAGASERERRGLLVSDLREHGDREVSLATVVRLGSERCPDLSRHLKSALPLLELARQRQTFAEWAAHFTALLRALGWPGHGDGGRALSSAEFQSYERWRDLLDDLCSLDLVLDRVDRGEALARLEALAAGAGFQPGAEGAPVQVMGPLEAAGLHFDKLWVMGFDDETWPSPPQPNPMLPIHLQRVRGMPHASAERELAFAEHITGRLRRAAREIVFSHAESRGAARLGPSPLIADIPETTSAKLEMSLQPGIVDTVRRLAVLEARSDTPLSQLPPGAAPGSGVRLFEDMAACPFKAQAAHRLGASSAALPEQGFNAIDHGILLHGVLQRVWAQIKTQAQLRATDFQSLIERIKEASEAVVEGFGERNARLTPGLRALEAERLVRLVGEFLDLERLARSPFSVESSEQRVTATVGGIALDLRIDRVDTLATGGRLLIDYKTGQVNPAGWQSDRPDAPQLPLYAITRESAPRGLAVAQVRTGDIRFTGLSDGDIGVPGVFPSTAWRWAHKDDQAPATTWPELMTVWRRTLTGLAERFRAGEASVDPRNRDTCTYCPLPGLCRIDERGLLARASGADSLEMEKDGP